MHRIQCALFLCTCHNKVSLAELSLVISKATTIAFIFHPSSRYQIQPDIGHVSDILQNHPITYRRCQTDISDADYLALALISHLYIAMVPCCLGREPSLDGVIWKDALESITQVYSSPHECAYVLDYAFFVSVLQSSYLSHQRHLVEGILPLVKLKQVLPHLVRICVVRHMLKDTNIYTLSDGGHCLPVQELAHTSFHAFSHTSLRGSNRRHTRNVDRIYRN